MIFKVILSAYMIPLGSTVTKVTGEKPYTLRDAITIYGKTIKDRRVIKADKGTLFLVNAEGDINVIDDAYGICWRVEGYDLQEYLKRGNA